MTVTRQLKQVELWKVFDIFWAATKNNWLNVQGYPYPVDPNYLALSWARLMDAGTGVAYAGFEGETPVSLFLGIIAPDLHNGILQGVEYAWAGKNGTKLLEEFEAECKSRGCKRVVCGLHPEFVGDRAPILRRLYRRKGFSPMTESFVKVL